MLKERKYSMTTFLCFLVYFHCWMQSEPRLGTLDEVGICRWKLETHKAEGAPDTSTSWNLSQAMWTHKKNTPWEIPESYHTDSSQIKNLIWKHPTRSFILQLSKESPCDWRHLGKATYPELGLWGGLKLRRNISVDATHPKICNIPFSYFEADL